MVIKKLLRNSGKPHAVKVARVVWEEGRVGNNAIRLSYLFNGYG